MEDEGERSVRPDFTHWHASRMEATTGRWAEKRRLAASLRRVVEGLVTSDAPEEELARAAEAAESFAERLAEHPRSGQYQGWAETSPAGDVAAFFDQSPLIGQANPLAPPIELTSAGDGRRVEGRALFGSAYEGPPGCVHGGFVAAAFDEVLGFANSLSGTPGMTARLIVHYRKPTPLHTELRFRGELERVEGRKIFCRGALHAGDRLTAEAEGLFVSVGAERFRALFEERERERKGRGAG